ncbi:MAG: hypothetical protein A2V85_10905 [Chloroflexi bacterium RBG_16_72_14]|nr:MAG: hypothetical protein A2V85_10905 [Chloroflexi bacterium RBG_16_72_14]
MRPSIQSRARRTPLLALAGLALVVGASPLLVSGADHLDAPAVKLDHRIDITDVYAFRAGAGSTALVLNVDGLMTPAASRTATFRPNALYELKIDRDQNGAADLAYRVRFSDPRANADGTRTQSYVVRRATGAEAARNVWTGAVVAVGRTTPWKHAVRSASIAGGGMAFAGTRDDPFFFDLPGFVTFKHELLGGTTDLPTLLGDFTGSDTFAGTNVLSIVLRLPNEKLGGTGNSIGVFATTSVRSNGGWRQVDRMGRPAINTVFNGLILPEDSDYNGLEKDAFNVQRPSNDRGTTTDNVTAVLDAIGGVLTANGATPYTAGEVGAIANVLLPDELTLTLGSSAHFASGSSLATLALNGRYPGDDVIDAEFALLTNFVITTGDGVNANDKSLPSTFPYLASPH